MITFRNLGYNGQLGNQMFTYAALRGISDKVGVDCGFPISNQADVFSDFNIPADRKIMLRLELMDGFDKLQFEDINYDYKFDHVYFEPYFNFDVSAFKIKDRTDINGWFQSSKYFEHIETSIKTEFEFKESIQKVARSKYSDVRKNNVAVHIRLGDMQFKANFATATLDYFKTAIKKLDDGTKKFYIFSDNVGFCKNNLYINKNVEYIDDKDLNKFENLCFFSMFDHFIISNSTYTWWGAWLSKNPNKIIIRPKKWFNSEIDQSDITPKTWLQI